jgi:hypothetical protein
VKQGSSKTRLRYGQALLHSGLSRLRWACDSQLDRQRLSAVLTRAALTSMGLAAIGVSAGLFRFRRSGRNSISRTIAYGVAGSAIGFAAGFTWETRDLTTNMARSALKEISTVRDERWIEKHPVNYG